MSIELTQKPTLSLSFKPDLVLIESRQKRLKDIIESFQREQSAAGVGLSLEPHDKRDIKSSKLTLRKSSVVGFFPPRQEKKQSASDELSEIEELTFLAEVFRGFLDKIGSIPDIKFFLDPKLSKERNIPLSQRIGKLFDIIFNLNTLKLSMIEKIPAHLKKNEEVAALIQEIDDAFKILETNMNLISQELESVKLLIRDGKTIKTKCCLKFSLSKKEFYAKELSRLNLAFEKAIIQLSAEKKARFNFLTPLYLYKALKHRDPKLEEIAFIDALDSKTGVQLQMLIRANQMIILEKGSIQFLLSW